MDTTEHAQIAYDAFAPVYDDFNAQNDYEFWFSVLLPKLEGYGLRQGKLLDVACGTGRSFPPMLRRGWEIMACDISAGMIARAKAKFPDADIAYDVADMKKLPTYGEFELVWALNDPVNYLVGDGDLQSALEALGANLAADGLLVFDCNTLMLFRASFEPETGLRRDSRWRWEGRGATGGVYEAEVSGEGIATHVHRERHYTVPEVQRTMLNAGLQPVAALGQREDDGLVLTEAWDEGRDHKIVHVARRS
ncbi:MAG: class I SAM-dependent methyltransferase [Actinobacteria bacterium]|nr:class I SAM-dependent methyltransferase [Actinomycetota bacterium]